MIAKTRFSLGLLVLITLDSRRGIAGVYPGVAESPGTQRRIAGRIRSLPGRHWSSLMALRFESLGREHDRAGFRCGIEPLDLYLQQLARKDVGGAWRPRS